MSDRQNITIIGAGMAGLSAAYHLQKRGFSTTVFEKVSMSGGHSALSKLEHAL
ncbi:MAG: FAD-dependent oxidoreductase [Halieaceae bacterium]|nr:FAD-dependent oxidoreductase [Halieaceae bacterium]